MEILNYQKYIKYLKEGLISTYNIEKYQNNLKIELDSIGIKYDINILSKFNYDLTIYNLKELSNDILKYCININQNILGYFPSYIWITNNFGENGFKFDEKYLDIKYNKIVIRFEAKYEDGLYGNNLLVPDFAYHLSTQNKKEKILNNGLYPKSYNKKTKHPDIIYFFYNLDDLDELLNSIKINDKINRLSNKYILFKVEFTEDMKNKIIIHSDPNYKKGFFIYDNISSKNISIEKENL
jgi:hypothetical protein